MAALGESLRGRAHIAYASSLAALLTDTFPLGTSVVLLSVRTPDGTATWSAAVALRLRWPGLQIVGVVMPTSADLREMRSTGSDQFVDFVIVGIDDVAATIDAVLHDRTGERPSLLELARQSLRPEARFILDRSAGMVKINPSAGTLSDMLAFMLRMSRKRLVRHFHGLGLAPPATFVRWVRVLAAAERIRNGDTVEQVSHEFGFGSPEVFRRVLRRLAGIAPRETRVETGAQRLVDAFARNVQRPLADARIPGERR
jgi:AraC-like DNA-binding protein